jgi:hypothetical protein
MDYGISANVDKTTFRSTLVPDQRFFHFLGKRHLKNIFQALFFLNAAREGQHYESKRDLVLSPCIYTNIIWSSK